MASLYVRDKVTQWLKLPDRQLAYIDTINLEEAPPHGMWSTLVFLPATTETVTYCGSTQESGQFDFVALGPAGVGSRDLVAACEHDVRQLLRQVDPDARLTLLRATTPDDFLQGGSVPWYTVSMAVAYLCEHPPA